METPELKVGAEYKTIAHFFLAVLHHFESTGYSYKITNHNVNTNMPSLMFSSATLHCTQPYCTSTINVAKSDDKKKLKVTYFSEQHKAKSRKHSPNYELPASVMKKIFECCCFAKKDLGIEFSKIYVRSAMQILPALAEELKPSAPECNCRKRKKKLGIRGMSVNDSVDKKITGEKRKVIKMEIIEGAEDNRDEIDKHILRLKKKSKK